MDDKNNDKPTLERLTPQIYDELRRLANRMYHQGGKAVTLQPTALVHEAFVRLQGADLDIEHRQHLIALIARTMRHVLVDHAREKGSQKRGGDRLAVTYHEDRLVDSQGEENIVELHDALEQMHDVDPRCAEALELHYFGGLTYEEVAQATTQSTATVHRQLRIGKAWLRRELNRSRDESAES